MSSIGNSNYNTPPQAGEAELSASATANNAAALNNPAASNVSVEAIAANASQSSVAAAAVVNAASRQNLRRNLAANLIATQNSADSYLQQVGGDLYKKPRKSLMKLINKFR